MLGIALAAWLFVDVSCPPLWIIGLFPNHDSCHVAWQFNSVCETIYSNIIEYNPNPDASYQLEQHRWLRRLWNDIDDVTNPTLRWTIWDRRRKLADILSVVTLDEIVNGLPAVP